MDDVFTQFYAQADGLILDLVVNKYAAIADMVRGPLIVSAAIYIAVVGFAVMRGIVSEGIGALMASGFKLALIIAAATGSYGSWVAASANELPTASPRLWAVAWSVVRCSTTSSWRLEAMRVMSSRWLLRSKFRF